MRLIFAVIDKKENVSKYSTVLFASRYYMVSEYRFMETMS